jgi:site-specific recombinase XerD
VPAELVAQSEGIALERLANIEAKIALAVRRSRAEATLVAYESDWRSFSTWCAALGLSPLPAAPGTVAGYLVELADAADDRSPRRIATLRRRLAAISEAHRMANAPNPTGDALVRETMAGLRRVLGVAPTRKRGITTGDVRAAVMALGERPIDRRDRALLLLGFAGGFRRSELVGLDVDDLEDHPDGLLVHLRRSKTDPEGVGRRVEIAYGQADATCPVRATRRWIDTAGITSGPVLRPVDRHGHIADERLRPQAVARIVQKHMMRLGHPTSEYSGHSLRRGMASTAARNGAPERTIMRATGHTSTETVRSYISDAEIFTDPASRYLHL